MTLNNSLFTIIVCVFSLFVFFQVFDECPSDKSDEARVLVLPHWSVGPQQAWRVREIHTEQARML